MLYRLYQHFSRSVFLLSISAMRDSNVNVLQAWAQNDEDIKYLATLKLVSNGGGPLSDKSAKKLIDAGVKLATVYGGTEFGVHSIMCDIDYSGRGDPAKVKTPDDWAWMAFPDFVRWDPQGDGSYELQFLVRRLPTSSRFGIDCFDRPARQTSQVSRT